MNAKMNTKETVPDHLIHQFCVSKDDFDKLRLLKQIKEYDIRDYYGIFLDLLKNIDCCKPKYQKEILETIKDIFEEQKGNLFLASPSYYTKNITLNKIYVVYLLDCNEYLAKYACMFLAQTLKKSLNVLELSTTEHPKCFNIQIKTKKIEDLEYINESVESLLNVIASDLKLGEPSYIDLPEEKLKEYIAVYQIATLHAKLENQTQEKEESKSRPKL